MGVPQQRGARLICIGAEVFKVERRRVAGSLMEKRELRLVEQSSHLQRRSRSACQAMCSPMKLATK